MRSKLSWPLFILLMLMLHPLIGACAQDAFAVPPNNMDDPEQYTRVGSTHHERQWSTPTSAGTAGLVLDTPGDNTYTVGDQHLYEYGTSIRISCQAAAIFHWVLDTSVTIATTGLVTDAAPISGNPATGGNAAFRVEAGTYVEETVVRTQFMPGRVGRRTGFCTATTLAATSMYAFFGWPCDADADCPSSGACRGEANGSCIESSVDYCQDHSAPFFHIRGAFLQSLGATAADCWVTEVR